MPLHSPQLDWRQPAGFSLIELLIVIALLGILVGIVLPESDPALYDQLRAIAHILRTDLAYGRSLAVANNSTYKLTFDTKENRYLLEHSGSNAALDELPDSPFRNPGDPPDQHIVDLDDLPHVGPTVHIVTVTMSLSAPQRVADVEFGPLGETTRSEETVIHLGVGHGEDARYTTLTIDPVTGLAEIGEYTSQGPPAALLPPDD